MTHRSSNNDSSTSSTGNPAALFGAEPIKASWWNRIFGVPSGQQTDPAQSTDSGGPDFESPQSQTESRKDAVPQIAVWVTKPARTPLEAFKDTISEGTRLFCEQNVHPLYVEDNQTKFRVTGIKMYVPKGDSQLTSILEELPIDVRNRLARLRAQSAPGAAEQLVFDEGFFGISIDIEPAVIEGQQIRLIAAWSGGSVDIKMVFTGQYITVKAKQEPKSSAPDANALTSSEQPIPMEGSAASIAPDALRANKHSTQQADQQAHVPSELVRVAPQDELFRSQESEPPEFLPSLRSKDTPLGMPAPSTKMGQETPLSTPAEKPIGLIRVLAFGASQETVISITAKMLPFMLGREHTSSGRFIHGYSMASEENEAIARLVSREHFELNHFERDESRFYVINHAVEKNGSFYNGCNVPERFSFKALAPKNSFVLGGAEGEGTVRIVIEAV